MIERRNTRSVHSTSSGDSKFIFKTDLRYPTLVTQIHFEEAL